MNRPKVVAAALRWAPVAALAIAAAACGSTSDAPPSASTGESQLQVNDATNEVVLTNTSRHEMVASPRFSLEESHGDNNWVSGDETLGRIGSPQSNLSTPYLNVLKAGGEQRYPMTYLDQLPSGTYRVTLGISTGDSDKINSSISTIFTK